MSARRIGKNAKVPSRDKVGRRKKVAVASKRAAKRRALPQRKPAAAKASPVEKPAGKALAPAAANGASVQPTRDPRKISLARVIKRTEMGDLVGLAKSIDDRGGLIQPIAIMHDKGKDYLIAGQRRMAAWPLSKFHGQPIPVHLMPSIDSILAGEWDENAQRKDFIPSESVALMKALLPEAKRKAKERQREHGKTAPGKAAKQDPDAGRAEDHLARYLGRDRKTLQKAADVVEAAKRQPKRFGGLLEAMDKTGNVNGPWRRLQIARQVDAIGEAKKTGKLTLPEGKNDRAVVDFAWPHEPGNETPDRATRPYATMSIADGCELMAQLGKRLAKDATVYFWTTGFHMQYAYTLLRAAGLLVPGDARKAADDPTKGAVNAPTIITWVKDGMGRGQRLREKTEYCIVAIKGNPTWNLTDETTELRGPSGENSEKPQTFYDLIDRISPAQRSIELFARRELPEGWVGWGDQVGTLKKAKANDAKADKDRARLRKRGEKLGHEIAIRVDSTGEDAIEIGECTCGMWKCRMPLDENTDAMMATAMDEHWRDAIARTEQAQAEKAAKGRGRKHNGRVAGTAAPAAEGKLFNDHGVPGHTIRMHNEGGMARATCECGGFSCEYPSVNDREAAVQAHWAAVRGAGAPAESAETGAPA